MPSGVGARFTRRARKLMQKQTNVQKITNSYSVQDSRKSITLIDRKSIYRVSVDRYGFSKKNCRIHVQGQKLIQNDMQHGYVREFGKIKIYTLIDRISIDRQSIY